MSALPPEGSPRTHDRGLDPLVRLLLRGRPRSPRPRRGIGRGLRRGVLLAGVVTAVVLTGIAPVGATTTDDAAGPTTARLVLNGLQAVVGPSGDPLPDTEEAARLPAAFSARALVQNLTDEPLGGLRLVLAVHERSTSRSALRAALDETTPNGLGRVEHLQLLPLDPVPPRGFAQLEVTLDAEEAGLVDPEDDMTIHPVVISLDRGTSVLDEVRTAAVGVSRPIARPLETVALAPLDGPAPGVGAASDAPSALLPGGRLDRILRALEAAPAGTATVAPAVHAAQDLQRLVDSAAPGATDMLSRLRTVVTDLAGGLVSSPYAYADVPALTTDERTRDLSTAAIVAGRQRLVGLVGRAPDAAHLLVPGQTPASLDLAPADVLVTAWDEDSEPDLEANPTADVPPALRTHRSRSGRALDVLMGDPWVTSQLADATGAHGWEVDAHRVVAETAITFAQAPGREGRVLAVVPPLGWEAPGRLPDEVYARLAAAPWLRLADPVTVAARGRVAAPWEPPPGVAVERTVLLSQTATLQERLEGLAAAVVDIEEQPAVVGRGDDLLRAMTVWPQEAADERAREVLQALADDIDEAIGEVLVPPDSAVTLASERGVIPVTVQHPTGVPMDVLVDVTTPGGLTFQETSRAVRLEEGSTTTVSFEVTALGRGEFPMRVTVRTPTGDVVLAREVVQVRASAVSRPALLVIGGVVLLLLIVGRIRRPEQPRLEVVR